MLKLRLVSPGKDKEPWLAQGIEHYRKLLSRFVICELCFPAAPRLSAALSEGEYIEKEAAILLPWLGDGFTIACDIKGQTLSTEQLATKIERWEVEGRGRMNIVIGGAHGLAPTILKAASFRWSFSPMTFPHQLARIIALEQIYRAFTIRQHLPYHK